MNPHLELGFQLANEHAKQLITLSTGVLAISITFRNENVLSESRWRWWLVATWLFHLVSATAGILAMSALTGEVMPLSPSREPLTGIGDGARMFSGIQFVCFFLGLACITIFGIGMLPNAARDAAGSGPVREPHP